MSQCLILCYCRTGFVRADRLLALRQLLDQLSSTAGLINEEKGDMKTLKLHIKITKQNSVLHSQISMILCTLECPLSFSYFNSFKITSRFATDSRAQLMETIKLQVCLLSLLPEKGMIFHSLACFQFRVMCQFPLALPMHFHLLNDPFYSVVLSMRWQLLLKCLRTGHLL